MNVLALHSKAQGTGPWPQLGIALTKIHRKPCPSLNLPKVLRILKAQKIEKAQKHPLSSFLSKKVI